MVLLSSEQQQRAVEVMREYLAAPGESAGKTLEEEEAACDLQRARVIEEQLKPLLTGYLQDEVGLSDFKSKIDGINKRNELWGFRGIKGQMFFNMVVNVADVADDPDECDQEVKGALAVPTSEPMASSRIKTFASYVKRLGEQWVDAGHTHYGRPKVGSIPFFLSYFWHVQDRDTWPVYYTNAVNTMTDLNLWQPSGDSADDYVVLKRIHEELAELFTKASGRPFNLYDVEHVFWLKGGNPYGASSLAQDENRVLEPKVEPEGLLLPESYLPPIIAILPRMARNEMPLVEAAKRSGTTLDRAFEKYIYAAFTILGYETRLLGQGQGRVPDGSAIDPYGTYAILWDAKIRGEGYSMGTDDRVIREYITTQTRDFKRRRSLRNIYYLIISSTFVDDCDDTIRSIKMETEVSEVVLVEADALVEMVDAKLRAPLQLPLGPDGLQRLFSISGVLTAAMVREQLI